MAAWQCYEPGCRGLVSGRADETTTTCPRCGSTNGEFVTGEQVRERMALGVYFNIDPRTGKRAKKRKR